jgi:Uma2 family endonuclease
MATITTPESELEPNPVVPPDQEAYEIHDGRIMEMPPMGTYPVELASILHEHLGPFARRAGLGRSIIEVLFRIDPQTQYRPDLAFVSDERWPKGRRAPKRQPWEIVPDLAVEVISENDPGEQVLTKVRDYFRAGVRAVWLVYPSLEVIHVFDSFTRIRVLTLADDLDGGDIVPGFRLPLATLFEGEAAEEPAEPSA